MLGEKAVVQNVKILYYYESLDLQSFGVFSSLLGYFCLLLLLLLLHFVVGKRTLGGETYGGVGGL